MDNVELRNRVVAIQTIRRIEKRRKKNAELSLKMREKRLRIERKTLGVLVAAATILQRQIRVKLGGLASKALRSVLHRPYELGIDFLFRRNNLEAHLHFLRNEFKIDPLEASGIGAVDVAALMLNLSTILLTHPTRRPDRLLITDEPLRHLKGEDANERALAFLKSVCDQLRFQIIMVADERVSTEVLQTHADNIIEVIPVRSSTPTSSILQSPIEDSNP